MAAPLRVLITGIEGFTGHYVAEEFRAAGYEVFGTCLGPSTEASVLSADLNDVEAVRRVIAEVRPHKVVHLAAISFVGHSNAEAFYRVNVVGTRNLLAALAEADQRPDCVLLASSANVYGNSACEVLDEDTPFNPANDYAVSKIAMEYMARLWMDRLPIVITRPFNYTGVGQAANFLLPKIVDHFKRREAVIELGNLDVWRDFSDVRSVAHIYRRLTETAPAGLAVNVCSGQSYSLREIIAMAEELSGHTLEVRVNPAFVRANEVRYLRGDVARLRSFVSDWPITDFKETLRWMLLGDDARCLPSS